jgi:hypothetical protein
MKDDGIVSQGMIFALDLKEQGDRNNYWMRGWTNGK